MTHRILVVDDEPEILEFFTSVLERRYQVDTAMDGADALTRIGTNEYDVIVSDISMPGMDGMRLLRRIREKDLDVPVILITGVPTLDSAIEAVEHGALRYLTKPVRPADLREIVAFALSIRGMAVARRTAFELISGQTGLEENPIGLEQQFDKAIEHLWIAYQPIVSWSARTVVGYEALLRTDEQTLKQPLMLLEAARRLGRTHALGQVIRKKAAGAVEMLPPDARMFVNLLLADLDDPSLYDSSSPLTRHSSRVVLEITEREPLEGVEKVGEKINNLRELGFKIAMDDLGAGHSGLATFIKLEPDIVKLDILLVHGVEGEPKKQTLIRSMRDICADLGVDFIAEGVETPLEREMLIELGCDLFQGYLFGRPEREIVPPVFDPPE